MSVQGIRAGRAFVELSVDDARLRSGLKGAQARLKAFGALASSIGGGLQRAGGQLLKLGALAGAGLGAATKVFADFDDQMRLVKAVTGANERQFASLTETAQKLGRTTSYTASQVASVMVELGRAGFSAQQVDRMTAGVLDLARATGTDAAVASGILAAAIRQFGLEAGDAARVADALTVAANGSFNTLESLGEALQYAGPVAKGLNMSIEETLALFAALGNAGLQGSSAGTVVRRLLTQTAAEAQKIKELFGVEAVDAAGQARPLIQVLAEIDAATKNLGNAERAQKFNEFFGLLGITGASILSQTGLQVEEFTQKLLNSAGAAARTAREMDAGVGGAFRMLMSAAEGVAIAVGDALAPVLKGWADRLAEVSAWITRFVNDHRELAVAVAQGTALALAAGAAFLSLGFVFSGLGSTLTMLAAALPLLVVALKGLILFGVPIAAAIALQALLFRWFTKNTRAGQALAAALGRAWGTLQADFRLAWQGIVDAFLSGDLAQAAAVAWQLVKLEWTRGVEALWAVWLQIKTALKTSFIEVLAALEKAINDYIDVRQLYDAFVWAVENIAKLWKTVTGALADAWIDLIATIKKELSQLRAQLPFAEPIDVAFRRIDAEADAAKRRARAQQNPPGGDALDAAVDAAKQQRLDAERAQLEAELAAARARVKEQEDRLQELADQAARKRAGDAPLDDPLIEDAPEEDPLADFLAPLEDPLARAIQGMRQVLQRGTQSSAAVQRGYLDAGGDRQQRLQEQQAQDIAELRRGQQRMLRLIEG